MNDGLAFVPVHALNGEIEPPPRVKVATADGFNLMHRPGQDTEFAKLTPVPVFHEAARPDVDRVPHTAVPGCDDGLNLECVPIHDGIA
jgi:hypothetical protein